MNEVGSLKDDIVIEPSVFEQQIGSIQSRVVSLCNAVHDVRTNVHRVAITIDDGYKDNYLHAYPILRKLNVPAAIFLSANNIDKRTHFWWDQLSDIVMKARKTSLEWRGLTLSFATPSDRTRSYHRLCGMIRAFEPVMENTLDSLRESLDVREREGGDLLLEWGQVREMLENGISFGSHSSNHRRLSIIQDADTLKDEIRGSKSTLEGRIGRTVDMFAYPYGRETDYDGRSAEVVQDAGYKYCFTAVANSFTPHSSLFEIPRIGVSRKDNANMFRLKVTPGYASAYHFARKVLRKDKRKSWL